MSESKENIFIFVPNLIGFARVILLIISLYFMPTHCVVACTCYITSALLDAFDGHAARYFNQSTKFGAMLDQLTDRAGTSCLMMTLGTFYPQYLLWFQLSMAIDITGHWLYLHTTTLQGKASHKFIDMSENPIMHLYYTNRTVLFSMCAGNEAFYAALYVMYFYTGPMDKRFLVTHPMTDHCKSCLSSNAYYEYEYTQWSFIGWVTKNLLSSARLCF
ncbi:hypothetical protein evm_005072 [Chilo suppressalis]|nr:hypothetical protein evm_005072 [Chilo suppressalis]